MKEYKISGKKSELTLLDFDRGGQAIRTVVGYDVTINGISDYLFFTYRLGKTSWSAVEKSTTLRIGHIECTREESVAAGIRNLKLYNTLSNEQMKIMIDKARKAMKLD